MSNEEILKAAEICVKTGDCDKCPLEGECCQCILSNYIISKGKEPAPAATGTSPNVKKLHTDNSTFLRICQEALLKVCDRIIEVDGGPYILGYIHSMLDILDMLKEEGENNAETN